MPRTRLTVQQIDFDGLLAVPETADATNDHDFINTGDQFLEVINAGGGAVVVTIPTPKTIKGLTIQDPVITVAAGTRQHIGPFPPTVYNQSGGLVFVDLDIDTSTTINLLQA